MPTNNACSTSNMLLSSFGILGSIPFLTAIGTIKDALAPSPFADVSIAFAGVSLLVETVTALSTCCNPRTLMLVGQLTATAFWSVATALAILNYQIITAMTPTLSTGTMVGLMLASLTAFALAGMHLMGTIIALHNAGLICKQPTASAEPTARTPLVEVDGSAAAAPTPTATPN